MVLTRSQSQLPSDNTKSVYWHFRRILEIVANLGPGEQRIIEGVPPEHALQIIESVETSRPREEKALRASYNAVTHSLLIGPMPYQLRNSCQPWLVHEISEMKSTGWLFLYFLLLFFYL
ncbi:hypothetical protein BGX38DRAFT_1163205 [Terfezia claveryi]|nr:hypothetical protein BGX38DRAFT_1163205 [Terfezia claveryi]